MTNDKLEEIALRIGMEVFGCERPADVVYAKVLLAELSRLSPSPSHREGNEMKLIRMHKEWGWEMWGLLGKNDKWFFGFSKAVSYVEKYKS